MTNPKPVTAYAAVSPDGRIDCDVMGRSEETARAVAHEWYEAEIPLSFIPVTVIPTEQYEAMVAALEIIAGRRQCLDNLMGNADVAHAALAALKEQDHG